MTKAPASFMRVTGGDGAELHVRIDGRDGADPVLFINSLGCTLDMWDAQAAALIGRYRVIRYDARGHGRSDAPPGDYALSQLGGDALAVLDAAGATRAAICGISLGGLTAQWLGLHAARRVSRLVLANTAGRIGTVESWTARGQSVLDQGMASIAEAAIGRFFSEPFRATAAPIVEQFKRTLLDINPVGYAGCCAALRGADLRPGLAAIVAPTLVIGGRRDVSTPPAEAESLAEHIPGAQLLMLDTAHLSNVEQPEAFFEAVRRHLESADG